MMTRMFYPIGNMRQARATRFAWFSAVVVLLAAMFPALGMVLRDATAGRIMVEICSAHGSRFIELARSETPEAPARDTGSVHCPLCVTAGDGNSLPPPVAGVFIIAAPASSLLPHVAPVLPVPEFTTPGSRAPPTRLS